MNRMTRIALGVGTLALTACPLAACHRGVPHGESAAGLAPGLYRAVLELPAGELPFGLEIEPEGAATVGYLVNGQERVRLSEVAVSGAHLEMRMPGYENRLIADAKDGRLLGEVVLSKAGGNQQHIRLHAQLGQAYRFFEKAGSH